MPQILPRFEHRLEPMVGWTTFLVRLVHSVLIAAAVVGGSLAIGMLGYHGFEGLSWTDALLNASMILGGMGPVTPLRTEAGKVFASCFALYAGLVFILTAAIILAPAVHRLLHRLHVEPASEGSDTI